MTLLAWFMSALLVAAYCWSIRLNDLALFNAANLVCGSVLLMTYAFTGAWAAMPLTAFFTVVGGYGVWRQRWA